MKEPGPGSPPTCTLSCLPIRDSYAKEVARKNASRVTTFRVPQLAIGPRSGSSIRQAQWHCIFIEPNRRYLSYINRLDHTNPDTSRVIHAKITPAEYFHIPRCLIETSSWSICHGYFKDIIGHCSATLSFPAWPWLLTFKLACRRFGACPIISKYLKSLNKEKYKYDIIEIKFSFFFFNLNHIFDNVFLK